LKDFGASKRLQDAQRRRALREVGVYRDLLQSSNLDTPRYLGSVWDEPSERFWLLLEWVEGPQLRHCEFQHWRSAVAWLARLHGHFARRLDELEGHDYLLRFDYSDIQSLGDSALQAVSAMSPSLANRLVPVVARLENMIDLMDDLPRTLVHGAFRPQQVVMSPSSGFTRLCVVDWESALIGTGLHDLAEFILNLAPPQIAQLMDDYRDEAARCRIYLPDRCL
jgi:aminoglycoside phosphotransferase (APT) family kinase protein